jgi:signal transduction histidine kinase
LQQVRREAETRARIEQARIEDRERFRRNSAADFHDEAGARITRINLYTGLVRQQAAHNPGMIDHLHKIENASRELSAGIRDLIWTMDPTRDTLADTLERLATFGGALFDATATAFKVGSPPQEFANLRMGMVARRAITLIMKEAMNNCAKYAGAHRCTLQPIVDEKFLMLKLQDDGQGFDPGAVLSADHHGLRNMRQRAVELGATLDIHSAHGQGCTLVLKIPISLLRTTTHPAQRP